MIATYCLNLKVRFECGFSVIVFEEQFVIACSAAWFLLPFVFTGVQKIMVTGTSVQGSRVALRLTRLYPSVLYCTVGVHQHDAKSWTEETEAELRELAANPECVAIGECGLDFNRNFSPPDVQLDVFQKQVELACDLQKPLFVHEREAHAELVTILEAFGRRLPPTVIHCFTGSAEHAAKYLQMGFYIGLTGTSARRGR